MTEFKRRASDAGAVDPSIKRDLTDALVQIQDPGYRVTIGFLLRILDHLDNKTEVMIEQIHAKLDQVMADEEKIKHMVLNGHANAHDAHHLWVSQQIASKEDCDVALKIAADRHSRGGYCDYAARKLEEEKVAQRRRWAIGDHVAQTLAVGATMFVVGLVIAELFPHLMKGVS